MYSGWLLTNRSGAILGVHQRIDKVSRRYLNNLIKKPALFPDSKHILHFEGKNGPDGIKAKSPGNDEPWHYYDPFDPEDSLLIKLVTDHYNNLVVALKERNKQKASFEAAWLAHALVDGLTPAHHFPYEQELSILREGQSKESRTSLYTKIVMPGRTRLRMVANNWKMWGPKGLFTNHYIFEWGVGGVMALMRYHLCGPTSYDIKAVQEIGAVEYFIRAAREVAGLGMYERFMKAGWTSKLARQTRDELVPMIIKTVTLAWYAALLEAKLTPKYKD
jgi:hypothetical protein